MTNVAITSDAGILALSNALNYADIRGYGATCDGVANDDAAIQLAIAAGYKNIYLPDNTLWIPDGDLIPAGINYVGADWETVVIKSSSINSAYITLGAKSSITNVAIWDKWGYDQAVAYSLVPPENYNTARSVRHFSNNRESATTSLSGWRNHGYVFIVGNAGLPEYDNDNPGLSVINEGGGDNVYLETHGLGMSINISLDANHASGVSRGINIDSYGAGYGITIYGRSGSTAQLINLTTDVNVYPIYINELANVASSLQFVSNSKTSGSFIMIYHNTSDCSSALIHMNMAVGSGSFTGEFIHCYVNNTQKFYVDYNGIGYFAGGFRLANAGTLTSYKADGVSAVNMMYIDGSDAVKIGAIDGATGLDLGIFGGGIERITVKSDGKVGIQNAAPAYEFDVAGSMNCSTFLRVNTKKFVFGANDSGGAGYRTVTIENA